MAKKKRSGGKQGWTSKLMNGALTALAFSRPLVILFSSGAIGPKLDLIMDEATFGLSKGAFNLDSGLRMYAPAGAAISLGILKSYIAKKFPIRR